MRTVETACCEIKIFANAFVMQVMCSSTPLLTPPVAMRSNGSRLSCGALKIHSVTYARRQLQALVRRPQRSSAARELPVDAPLFVLSHDHLQSVRGDTRGEGLHPAFRRLRIRSIENPFLDAIGGKGNHEHRFAINLQRVSEAPLHLLQGRVLFCGRHPIGSGGANARGHANSVGIGNVADDGPESLTYAG